MGRNNFYPFYASLYTTYIYIYIYMYILSSSRKRPDGCLFYGFHRRDSRGPVAAGNHLTKRKERKEKRRKP